jgi:putative FmdB family regulatory protein
MLALSVCECQPAEEHVPTYQYACTACDHRFEAVQSFSDASLTTCPACSGPLRKVFSSVGIVFKGSGFYRTDSRSGSGSTVPGGDSASKDGAGKDGSGKVAAAAKNGSSSDSGGSSSSTSSKDNGSSSSSSSSSSSTPAAAAS